jgi:HEAT repeat protein
VSLCWLGDWRAFDLLVKVMAEHDHYERLFVVQALASLDDYRVISIIRDALNDENKAVRAAAHRVVGTSDEA